MQVILVFKTLTHFLIVQGGELAAEEGKSAAALAACRTLAEELTELRFPAPRILAFKVIIESCENAVDVFLILLVKNILITCVYL